MNTDTTIAKNIRVADEKASYDAACKRLLSEKIILAWIMKNCLEEYHDCDVEEIAENILKVHRRWVKWQSPRMNPIVFL